MVDFVTGLRCRECGAPIPAEALHVCEFCFGPLEVAYDYERDRRRRSPGSRSPPGPAPSGATPTCCRSTTGAVDLGAGFTPAGAGRPAGRRARPRRAVDQERHREPDRVVQGPGRVGGADQGPRARASRWRPAPRPATWPTRSPPTPPGPGMELGRLHPLRPRAGQGRHDRGLRRQPHRHRRQLRRRQPAVRRADQRAPDAGRSSTSTCAPTTPRAPRPWPSRSPSSSAGGRPTTSWCPIGSGSQLTKIDKGFAELGKVGLLDEEPDVRISGAQAAGLLARWPPPSPRAPTSSARCSPTTIAKSLAIGNPADGSYALDVVRSTGGSLRRR